jgi:hypothetical protein
VLTGLYTALGARAYRTLGHSLRQTLEANRFSPLNSLMLLGDPALLVD